MAAVLVGIPLTVAAILTVYCLCRPSGKPSGPSWFDLSMPTRTKEHPLPYWTSYSYGRASRPSKKATGRSQQTVAHRRRKSRR